MSAVHSFGVIVQRINRAAGGVSRPVPVGPAVSRRGGDVRRHSQMRKEGEPFIAIEKFVSGTIVIARRGRAAPVLHRHVAVDLSRGPTYLVGNVLLHCSVHRLGDLGAPPSSGFVEREGGFCRLLIASHRPNLLTRRIQLVCLPGETLGCTVF